MRKQYDAAVRVRDAALAARKEAAKAMQVAAIEFSNAAAWSTRLSETVDATRKISDAAYEAVEVAEEQVKWAAIRAIEAP